MSAIFPCGDPYNFLVSKDSSPTFFGELTGTNELTTTLPLFDDQHNPVQSYTLSGCTEDFDIMSSSALVVNGVGIDLVKMQDRLTAVETQLELWKSTALMLAEINRDTPPLQLQLTDPQDDPITAYDRAKNLTK